MNHLLLLMLLVACPFHLPSVFAVEPGDQPGPLPFPAMEPRPPFDLGTFDLGEVDELLRAAHEFAERLGLDVGPWSREDVTQFRPFSDTDTEPRATIMFRNRWGFGFHRDASDRLRLTWFSNDARGSPDRNTAAGGSPFDAEAALALARDTLVRLGYYEQAFPVKRPEVEQDASPLRFEVTWPYKWVRYRWYFRVRIDGVGRRVTSFHARYLSANDRMISETRRNAVEGRTDPAFLAFLRAASETATALGIDVASSWTVEDVTAYHVLSPTAPSAVRMSTMFIADRWRFREITPDEGPVHVYSFVDLDRAAHTLKTERDLAPFLRRPRISEKRAVLMAREAMQRLGAKSDVLAEDPLVQQASTYVSNEIGERNLAAYTVQWPTVHRHPHKEVRVGIDAVRTCVSSFYFDPDHRQTPPP